MFMACVSHATTYIMWVTFVCMYVCRNISEQYHMYLRATEQKVVCFYLRTVVW